jgi:CBS domain-containing protein
MKIEQIMTSQLFTCRPEDSLQTAAGIMWDHDVGCVPVTSADGKLVAVITDRDIAMAAYLCGGSLAERRVTEAMSKKVFSVQSDDEVRQVEHVMRTYQIRRVPVVDAAGRPVGLVALNDLTRTVRGRQGRDGVVGAAAVAATLAAVGAPRRRPATEVPARAA